MAAPGPTRAPNVPPRPQASEANRSRPSPRPARLMIGAGAIAAVTIIGAGLVRSPLVSDEGAMAAAEPGGSRATGDAERPVTYVRLRPGQTAPKGARVIREAAPTPRVVVRQAAPEPNQRNVRVVTRTRQSG